MNRLLTFLISCAVLISCTTSDEFDDPVPFNGDVYVPVYADPEEAYDVKVSDAKDIVKPAKIFTYNQFLMVNIVDQGFHVIDNSNPAAPINLFFVEVPGNKDVAIKDGLIIADNYSDLIAFRITEDKQLQIVERMKNVMNNQDYPPLRGVYFECVDPEKGLVIDWVIADVEDPKCYRP